MFLICDTFCIIGWIVIKGLLYSFFIVMDLYNSSHTSSSLLMGRKVHGIVIMTVVMVIANLCNCCLF